MCGGCRKAPPPEVCHACIDANNGCTSYCRDAFVYDVKIPDEKKIELLKLKYVEGGGTGELTMGVKIPNSLLELL